MHRTLDLPRWGGASSRRLLGHAAAVVAIVFVGYYDLLVAATSVGLDSHAYWAAWTHPLYSIPPGHVDAFLYAPVIAEVLWPLGHLPADVFIGLWAAVMLAVFAWLLRPLPPVWYLVGLLLCLPEALEGNINALLALMVVVGFRYPAAWALALLTKVSTGVGLLWFVVRGRWQAWLAAVAARGGAGGRLLRLVARPVAGMGGPPRLRVRGRRLVLPGAPDRRRGPRGVGRADRSRVDRARLPGPRLADPLPEHAHDPRRDPAPGGRA